MIDPQVQDIMQIYIRKQRGQPNRPVAFPSPLSDQLPVFQHSRVQPLGDQPQDPLVRDPVPEETHRPSRSRWSKKPRMSASSTQFTFVPDPADRASSASCWDPSRPEPVGEALEVRLVNRVQHLR